MGVVVVGEKKKRKKKKVSNATKSVFESMPAETKASVGHSSGCQLPDTNEASVFESKPRASTAHVSSEKAVLPDMEGPSVCESNPDESTWAARAGSQVNDTPKGPSVCESTPAISRASITAADAVPISNGGVCESQPAESSAHVKAMDPATADMDQTSVFENTPGKSLATCVHSDVVEGVVEGQHVFESKPEGRKTDAAHGIEVVESGSEWETDSEAE